MKRYSKIYVAGHRGMVGSAICRALAQRGYPAPLIASHDQLDLTDQTSVRSFFAREKPDAVILAAARVGGIEANRSAQGAFLYENLMIASNVIDAAYQTGVARLLFLGSSCIYPRLAPQPIPEEALLTGALEPTNEGYALAKIAGLKLCTFYRQQYGVCYHALMPTNLYGTGDNYNLRQAHVLPTLIRKFDEAKQTGSATVSLWGTGTPQREFLHVDDLADATLFMLGQENPPELVNVGSGCEVTIRELAEKVRAVVGTTAQPVFDPTMPDGTPRKRVDSSRLQRLGWSPSITLEAGLIRTVAEYRAERDSGRLRG